jgi:hypothetical protein
VIAANTRGGLLHSNKRKVKFGIKWNSTRQKTDSASVVIKKLFTFFPEKRLH